MRQKTARRKLKDIVGNGSPDTFKLSRTRPGTREYCDLILISDRIFAWEKCMCEYSNNLVYSIEKKSIKANGKPVGHRLVFKNSLGVLDFSVSIYPGKKKIMLQPGDSQG